MTARHFRVAAILFALLISPAGESAAVNKPKLVVQITADQLRGDLLERYRSVLTDGLARIENGGYWIRRGRVDHGLTLSFPGHATLSTGMYPSRHGLTANEWWENQRGLWGEVAVSADEHFRMLDPPERPGPSPRNMTATTLGEWIKSSDPRSKSVALGTGNSIPIAYGGKQLDAVYWFDESSGRFTSSTYYSQTMASWVSEFNAGQLPNYEMQTWTLSVPSAAIGLSNPDATPYENQGRFNTFPHAYALESRPQRDGSNAMSYSRWFARTPLKDEALFALAAAAVDAEKLGGRGVTDYLAVDVDSTDEVGHIYGPLSLEQLDTLVRLDRALGRFLRHLDATIGKDNYVLAFSADHGVADPPEAGGGGRRIRSSEIEAVLDRVDAIAASATVSRDALIQTIVAELKRSDFIADAYPEAQLAASSEDPFVQLYQHSYRPGFTTDFPLWTERDRPHHPARYGILVRFKENMVFDAATGIHGSPYAAERLVPIIFYGMNIKAGNQDSGGRTVDVAPTLAAAAHIASPAGLDGAVLGNVLCSDKPGGKIPVTDSPSCR